MIRFLLSLSLCFLVFFFAEAQENTFEATIPTISADGFYKIPLPAQVLSKAKNQFSRVRILEGSKEVPFLIKTEAAIISKNLTENLAVIERKDQDSSGFIIFENPDAVRLSLLVIKIKRVWVSKTLKITGSNDRKSWFTVRSEFLLNTFHTAETGKETTVNYQVNIPLTDYKFYKIESGNRDNLSMNVLSIGYVSNVEKKNALLALPETKISKEKTDEPSESLFKVSFTEPYIVNQLVFDIAKPRFFQRNVRLYLSDPRIKPASRNGNVDFNPKPYKSFILSSNDSINEVFLPNNSLATFFIVIENQDNPPLEFVAVKAFQNKNFIQTYLEKGKDYTLKIGSSDLAQPQYDLAAFENKIGNNIQILNIGELRETQNQSLEIKETIFKTKYWIWLGLTCVAALLIYMSAEMIKELKSNDQTPH